MAILIREGSAARNFETLHPLISRYPGRIMLCTDDCHPDDLARGHIDRLVARAIAHAREIQRPVRIDDPNGAALYLDPRSGLAYQARSANAHTLLRKVDRGFLVGATASVGSPGLFAFLGRVYD